MVQKYSKKNRRTQIRHKKQGGSKQGGSKKKSQHHTRSHKKSTKQLPKPITPVPMPLPVPVLYTNQLNTTSQTNDLARKMIVGKIYANWCGHCKSLEPEWDSMKETVHNNLGKNGIQFVEIEDTNAKTEIDNLNEKYLNGSADKVVSSGYPTIFIIRDGKVYYFEGSRLAPNLNAWINKLYN